MRIRSKGILAICAPVACALAWLGCIGRDPLVTPEPIAPSEEAGARGEEEDAEAGVDARAARAPLDCAIFCDDFERESLLGAWTEQQGERGWLTLDAMRATSPSRSLKVTVPAQASGVAYLRQDPPPGRTRFGVAFSLLVDEAPDQDLVVADMSFGAVDTIALRLTKENELRVTEIVRTDAGDLFETNELGAPLLKQFVRYRLAFDLDVRAVTLESSTGLVRRMPIRLDHGVFSAVRVGLTYNSAGTKPASYSFDDVELFDVPPL